MIRGDELSFCCWVVVCLSVCICGSVCVCVCLCLRMCMCLCLIGKVWLLGVFWPTRSSSGSSFLSSVSGVDLLCHLPCVFGWLCVSVFVCVCVCVWGICVSVCVSLWCVCVCGSGWVCVHLRHGHWWEYDAHTSNYVRFVSNSKYCKIHVKMRDITKVFDKRPHHRYIYH